MSSPVFVLTEIGERELAAARRRRAAVLTWLRSVERESTSVFDVVSACECRLALELKTRVGYEAQRWLEQRTRRGDALHRDWAEWLLDRVGSTKPESEAS